MRSIAVLFCIGCCAFSSALVRAEEKRPKSDRDSARTSKPTAKEPAAKPADVDQQKLEDFGEHRVLGGHVFPFATFVDTPFVMSFVGVTAGLEYHRVPGLSEPLALLGTGTGRVELQTLNVTETLDFALRLHHLFAVFGSAFGRARVGVDTPTLLGNGADYRYGADLGALVRALRVGPFQLSLRAHASYYAGQQAGITGVFHDVGNIVSDAIMRVVADPTLDLGMLLGYVNDAFRSATQELLVPFDGVRYGGSVNGALALGRYVGLQLALGIDGENAFYRPRLYDATISGTTVAEERSTTTAGRAAIAADFDGAPAGVPLDVMLEYALTQSHVSMRSARKSSATDSTEHLIALGLYYSGRPDLQLGVTVYSLLGQMPVLAADRSLSGHPIDIGTLFVFRYIW